MIILPKNYITKDNEFFVKNQGLNIPYSLFKIRERQESYEIFESLELNIEFDFVWDNLYEISKHKAERYFVFTDDGGRIKIRFRSELNTTGYGISNITFGVYFYRALKQLELDFGE